MFVLLVLVSCQCITASLLLEDEIDGVSIDVDNDTYVENETEEMRRISDGKCAGAGLHYRLIEVRGLSRLGSVKHQYYTKAK